MTDKIPTREGLGRLLEQVANGSRAAADSLLNEVSDHTTQAGQHLARHAGHQIVAHLSGEEPHPDSEQARQMGIMHAGAAALKFAVGEGLKVVGILAEAGAERLLADSETQIVDTLPGPEGE